MCAPPLLRLLLGKIIKMIPNTKWPLRQGQACVLSLLQVVKICIIVATGYNGRTISP